MAAPGLVEWTVFCAVVAIALGADIALGRDAGRASGTRHAVLWSGVWIGLGLLFGAWVALRLGSEAGIAYLTAYLLEKSLSVDNIFLFALIFTQTGVPPALQR